jgi:hypothetical protein
VFDGVGIVGMSTSMWGCKRKQEVETILEISVWAKTGHITCFLLLEPMLAMNNLFSILQKY